MWFLIIVSALCILTSAFFVWQLILAFQMSDSYGTSTNIIIIIVLVFVGILGVFAAVRRSKYCMNTFTVFSVVIIILSLVEIIITAVGTAKCETLPSDESDGMWNFICSSSSWVLIIPLSILSVLLVIGIILRVLLAKFADEEENGPGGEMDNYYPA